MLKRSRRADEGTGAQFSASSGALEAQLQEWMSESRRKIGEILLGEGVITADHLLEALEEQATGGRRIGEILIQRGLIDDLQLAAALSEQFDLEHADLRVDEPERAAVERVGEDLARRHGVVPLRIEDGDRIVLVTGEPMSEATIRDLVQHCERIRLLIGSPTDISRTLDKVYNALFAADQHIQAFELSDEDAEVGEVISLEVDENAPIVQVVNRVLIQGVRARASDIHIEPHEKKVVVRFRIDGALSEAIELPRRMGPPISSRLKVMSDLNIVERRRPQDGQFSVAVDNRPVDVRISVVSTVHGEKIVLRLLDKTRSL
ncbi:MAG: GspE/PulE family protein, partial [Actinomycetes bacterium]